MYFDKAMTEIERRLGPILEERGLQMHMDEGEERYLTFRRTDENGREWLSPFGFIFMDPERSGVPEANFDDNSIALANGRAEAHAVGSNEWTHYFGGWSNDFDTVGERGRFRTWDDAFQYAAHVLRNDPLVPDYFFYPKVLDSVAIYLDWSVMQEIAHDRGLEKVDVGRIGETDEFFEFEYRGATLRLLYDTNEDMRVERDGAEVELEFDTRGLSCREIVESHLDAVDAELEAGVSP